MSVSEKAKSRARKIQRERARRIRTAILNYFGNCCACCGESHKEFLTVDHKKGDGAEQRRQHGWGSTFYRWLWKRIKEDGEKVAKDFRLLCFNCNWCWGSLGYCVHEDDLTPRRK